MHKGAFLMLVVALFLVFAASKRAEAVQQYTCGKDICTCSGKADCIELRDSDWCAGVLQCGTVAGLPPGDCRCSIERKVPKVKPGTKVRPDVQVR